MMTKKGLRSAWAYALLALVLLGGVWVAKVDSFNYPQIIALLVLFVACIINRKHFPKRVVITARTIFGLLFVFSGFVKGVDPLGTQYVIHDYLQAYGLPWLMDLTLPGSFFLNMLEFTVGLMLVLNIKIRISATLAALIMLCFTATTLYDAIANPVPDCGCFGKAIILTNWQTFYKNIVLDCLIVIILFSAFRQKSCFSNKTQWILTSLIVLSFLGFEYYNYRTLPVVDFLDWKEGKVMMPEKTLPVKYYTTYKNTVSGEEKEYLSNEIPFNDAQWMLEWKYASSRVDDPNPKGAEIAILSEDGSDMTQMILSNSEHYFLVVVYDLPKARRESWDELMELQQEAEEQGHFVYYLTASTPQEVEMLKKELGESSMEFVYSDDTSLKGMIRSNPGVILMKGSSVIKHWHSRNIPDFDDILLQ